MNYETTAAPRVRPGGYRLPHALGARLQAAADGLRNAEAVMRLAVFLGRYHTAPGRLGRAFPVDRVALASHGELELSEARVRGALAALEQIGFLERVEAPGSAYRLTEAGLHRKPVLWRFGPTFLALFEKANAAALVARGRRSTDRRAIAPSVTPRPPVRPPVAQTAPLLARRQTQAEALSLGEQRPTESGSGLEAALGRLRNAVAGVAA